jgi:hypothetical protein
MKRIALAVVIFASQAVATFGGGPVGSSTQVTPPPSFFRPSEFDTGAFGTFVNALVLNGGFRLDVISTRSLAADYRGKGARA